MFSDSDPCGEAPGNDDVEHHDDKEWQPEESTDDAHLAIARMGGERRIESSQERRHTISCLTLCPDQTSTEGQAHRIIPAEDHLFKLVSDVLRHRHSC